MKILVFDDNEIHRKVAEVLLKGHDVTIVSTYHEASSLLVLRSQAKQEVGFDVFMTDLLVPASDKGLSEDARQKFAGQEMPVGAILALQALAAGIKRVAIVTDANHHIHPASAALDAFWSGGYYAVGDAKIICANYNPMTYLDTDTWEEIDADFLWSDAGERKYPNRQGYICGKAWNRFLELFSK